jgi:spore coat protein A, manganese oxidase
MSVDHLPRAAGSLAAVLLAAAVAVGAAAGAPATAKGQALAVQVPLNPAALAKYVDPLPIPAVAEQSAPGYYEMRMTESVVQLHRDIPATTVWGYNGGYLGPTIVASRGEAINVEWFNDLPPTHIFEASLDYSLNGMHDHETNEPLPHVRAVTHLHGGHVAEESDGGPDAWFLPGTSDLYEYPNDQEAATLWYHDHALGITRLNPYAGLAGGYVITDEHEQSLNLPGPYGEFDIPLIIQDKSFNLDGSQLYATVPNLPGVHQTWVPEFFGNTIMVNGKVWPYLEVEPRKYRFRLVNGSNSRFYDLRLNPEKDQNKLKPVIYQIGAEGGLLPAVAPSERLLIAPGERADVIVDFSPLAGQAVLMKNTARSPYPAGASADPKTVGQVMQFRVGTTLSAPDTSVIPANPRPITPLSTAGATVRTIPLTEILDPLTGFPVRLELENKTFHDPVSIMPELGATEVWEFVNTTADTHPIHLHLVMFQVLDRSRFDAKTYAANGTLKRMAVKGPNPNERGWKDTVMVGPGEVVRIAATFDKVGTFPFHCHILEHEENDMMRPFAVMPPGHQH